MNTHRLQALGLLLIAGCSGDPFQSGFSPPPIAGEAGAPPEPLPVAGRSGAPGSAATGGSQAAGGAGGGSVAGGGADADAGAAGAAGAGGESPNPDHCLPLPAKTAWRAVASTNWEKGPAELAIDSDLSTRYLSQGEQSGIDQWLEVDFGQAVTLSQVTLHTGAGEYTHGYRMRVSDEHADFQAPVIAEGPGNQGATRVDFAARTNGRYLMIHQTAAAPPAWWAIDEITATCE